MSLPVEDMASLEETMAGVTVMPPRDAVLLRPPPAVVEKFQRLHAAAGQLAESAPELIANPDAARGFEQTLIEAMVDCLTHGRAEHSSLAQGQHAVVMRRFRRTIEENPEQPRYIPEICQEIRV